MPAHKTKPALTLVELMAVLGITSILMFAVGVALVDGQKNWNSIRSRVYGGPTADSLVASKAFEAAVRKSVASRYDSDGTYARVYHYKDPAASTAIDGYVRFYVAQGNLMAEYGNVVSGSPADVTHTVTLARNVQTCAFTRNGPSVGMDLRLDDGRVAMTVSCAAIQNNM